MRRGFSLSYVFIPLVYVLIIGGLLYLQFSGNNLFRTDVGPISLSAAFEMGGTGEQRQITALSVQYTGLKMAFDDQRSLIVQTMDGRTKTIGLKSYDKLDSGFRLVFDDDIQIDMTSTDGEKPMFTMELEIPDNLLPLKSVRIPYATSADATVSASQNSPNLGLSHGGIDYALSLPTRSYVDAEKAYLVLPGDTARKSMRLAVRTQNEGDEVESYLNNQGTIISEKDYDDAITAYLNAAYLAWKGSRYNSGTGTWALRDGESKFNEDIMVALLAEAWQRNEYTRVYSEMRNAGDQHTANLTYKSAVFLGNLKRLTSEMLSKDKTEANRLLGLLEAKNNDVLLVPNLVQFAADRGGSKLRDSLRAYLDGLDIASLSPAQMLGLLRAVYLDPIVDPSFEGVLDKYKTAIKPGILKNLARLDEGFFFVENGKSDSFNSILAGRILMAASAKDGDARYGNLGRNMVLASLKLADEMAYLPQTVEFSGGAISSLGVQVRGPEDVYALLHSNPSYPKHHSLFKQAGPGQWYYTLARVESSTIKPREYVFNISYPRSRTHYLFFSGMPKIDPLTGMQLFGIIWRNASDFESYSKGRFYNPESKVLMIKYTDDSTSEVVKIFFQ